MKEEEYLKMDPLDFMQEVIIHGVEEASAKLKKVSPAAKENLQEWFRNAAWILAAIISLGFALVYLGLRNHQQEIFGIGRIVALVGFVMLLMFLAPLGVAYESITSGKITGKRYFTFVRHFVAYQLLATVLLITPWVTINMHMYFWFFN